MDVIFINALDVLTGFAEADRFKEEVGVVPGSLPRIDRRLPGSGIVAASAAYKSPLKKWRLEPGNVRQN